MHASKSPSPWDRSTGGHTWGINTALKGSVKESTQAHYAWMRNLNEKTCNYQKDLNLDLDQDFADTCVALTVSGAQFLYMFNKAISPHGPSERTRWFSRQGVAALPKERETGSRADVRRKPRTAHRQAPQSNCLFTETYERCSAGCSALEGGAERGMCAPGDP